MRARVDGDIVDCGSGATAVLTALATAFVQIGDTSRRIVLFDTTADPTHRAETDLELWGTDIDLMGKAAAKTSKTITELPSSELEATGYPIDKMLVMRYPRDRIRPFGRLAFVEFTTETYPSNLEAIAALLPSLVSGGVLAVSGRSSPANQVDQLLRNLMPAVPLTQVDPNYRFGIRP